MKILKSSTIGLCLASLALAQFSEPVNPSIPRENSNEVQQNRTLTSNNNYNSLSHANMGVGILEKQWSPFSLNIDFQSQKISSEKDSSMLHNYSFMLPSMIAGTPEQIAFSAYYGVTPLFEKVTDSLTLEMPLHHMGIGIATQNENKTFRFGFNGDLFLGKSMYEETQDSGRTVLGIENLSLSFGSSPSELISFDLGVFASGEFDSLSNVNDIAEGVPNKKEFFTEVVFPVPGINLGVNLGDSAFPVQSSFAYTYAPKNFSYATQRHGNTPNGEVKHHDKLKTDSISWNLKTRVLIEPKRRVLKVNPSVELGYMHNRHKRMLYGDDNVKLPWQNGGEHDGHRWETSSFSFGFGVDVQLYRFLDYWVEYGHSNMNLELTGDSLKIDNNNETDFDSHKENFHRIATGFEFALHHLPNINYSRSGELFFDASFMHLQESGIYKTYYGSKQFEQFNDIDTETQLWKYSPWETITDRVRTNDVSLGIRSTFANKSVEVAGRVHFVDQKQNNPDIRDMSGPHFEFGVTYNLVDNKIYK